MVRSYDDVRLTHDVQRTLVEVSLASAIDKVGSTTDLTIAHQVTLSVLTCAIGILPAQQIAVGDDDTVGLGIECQRLTLVTAGVADGQVVERNVVGCHVNSSICVDVATIFVVQLIPRDNRILA